MPNDSPAPAPTPIDDEAIEDALAELIRDNMIGDAAGICPALVKKLTKVLAAREKVE